MLGLDQAQVIDARRWWWRRELCLGHLAVDRGVSAGYAECQVYARLLGVLAVEWLALAGAGPVGVRSAWRAWQIVRDVLPLIVRALAGRLAWAIALAELFGRLERRPKHPRRRNRPTTRQRLLRATLKH